MRALTTGLIVTLSAVAMAMVLGPVLSKMAPQSGAVDVPVVGTTTPEVDQTGFAAVIAVLTGH